jgi:hypothetical protein
MDGVAPSKLNAILIASLRCGTLTVEIGEYNLHVRNAIARVLFSWQACAARRKVFSS